MSTEIQIDLSTIEHLDFDTPCCICENPAHWIVWFRRESDEDCPATDCSGPCRSHLMCSPEVEELVARGWGRSVSSGEITKIDRMVRLK